MTQILSFWNIYCCVFKEDSPNIVLSREIQNVLKLAKFIPTWLFKVGLFRLVPWLFNDYFISPMPVKKLRN